MCLLFFFLPGKRLWQDEKTRGLEGFKKKEATQTTYLTNIYLCFLVKVYELCQAKFLMRSKQNVGVHFPPIVFCFWKFSILPLFLGDIIFCFCYKIPRRFQARWKGFTTDGEPFQPCGAVHEDSLVFILLAVWTTWFLPSGGLVNSV